MISNTARSFGLPTLLLALFFTANAQAEYVIYGQPVVYAQPVYVQQPVQIVLVPVQPANYDQLTIGPNSVHLRSQRNNVTCDAKGCLYQNRYNNVDAYFSPKGHDIYRDSGGKDQYVKHQLVPVATYYQVPIAYYSYGRRR